MNVMEGASSHRSPLLITPIGHCSTDRQWDLTFAQSVTGVLVVYLRIRFASPQSPSGREGLCPHLVSDQELSFSSIVV